MLRTRGPWIAAGLAALLALPHVLWQAAHGWPTLEFMHNATTRKMAPVSVGSFLVNQILVMNPASFPLWAAGLVYALRARADSRARLVGVVYLVTAGIILASGARKHDYLVPAYPALFAAGGVALERLFARRGFAWLRVPIPAAMALLGAVAAPFAIPILSPDAFLRYERAVGIHPVRTERMAQAELPQHFADRFGWEEMAETVAGVFRRLPPEDQARCAIVTQNYGEAGAIDRFGRKLGLPGAISGHNNYWLWGYGRWDGSVLIIVGGSREAYARYFEQVAQVATVACDRCMPYERNLPIHVARRIRVPLPEYWKAEKLFL